jgi:hypothetical protein
MNFFGYADYPLDARIIEWNVFPKIPVLIDGK